MAARDLPRGVLEGHGVRLEPYSPEHLAALTDALARPDVFAGGWGGGPAGVRLGEEFAAWLPTYLPVATGVPYVVHDVAGDIIGTSSIGDLVAANESAHIGWTAYAPPVWGTRVNPACKLLLLSHLFDHGYGRVKLQADERNARSRAGILKLGATFEGITRREQQRADGSWRDTAVYSITIDDWPRVREGLLARLA
mgnify:CR=1 FL=1